MIEKTYLLGNASEVDEKSPLIDESCYVNKNSSSSSSSSSSSYDSLTTTTKEQQCGHNNPLNKTTTTTTNGVGENDGDDDEESTRGILPPQQWHEYIFCPFQHRLLRQTKNNNKISSYSFLRRKNINYDSSLGSDGISNNKNSNSCYTISEKFTLIFHKAIQFLLVFILLVTIGWSCIFIISENKIDWSTKLNYGGSYYNNNSNNANNNNKYLQEKDEFRIINFMGIFYLLPGCMALVFLYFGFRLPVMKNPTMSRLVQIPTPYGSSYWSRWDLSVVTFFVSVVMIGSFTVRLLQKQQHQQQQQQHWDTKTFWHHFTKLSGDVLVNILLVILLPVCKTCFWWDLFGLGFDRVLKFHRFLGRLFAGLVLLHGLSASVSLVLKEQKLQDCILLSDSCSKPMIFYGWMSGILFLPVFVTSLPWFRRNKFEWFYYTHLLVLPALVMAQLHHPSLVYYLAPGLTAYILDKMVGLACSRRPVRLVDLSVPVPGYTRMVLAVNLRDCNFQPGQWIKVKVPAISNWEWHPISIASAPNQSTITLDVKSSGDWSSKLEQLAKSISSNTSANASNSLPHIYLDRYQGCDDSRGFLNHEAVLMVAGGIGITPMLSVVRTVVAGGLSNIRKLVLVWVVKHESTVDLYRTELAKYQNLLVDKNGDRMDNNNKPCKIDILVHVTQSSRGDKGPIAGKNSKITAIQEENYQTIIPVDDKYDSLVASDNPMPFTKTVLGHGHHLILMVAASGGYLFGMLFGSSLANKNHLSQECHVMLQLFLATLFACTLSGLVLSVSFLYTNPRRLQVHDDEKRQQVLIDDLGSDDDLEEQREEVLVVNKGQRPNLVQIVNDMKVYCTETNISTVGVSVCGPDQLTESTMNAAYAASSPSIQFVLGEENFEW